ncbi:MAG: hypothetical protein ACYC2Y_00650 [Armatimonadota bacterium]
MQRASKIRLFIFFLSLAVFLISAGGAIAIDISEAGSWTRTVDANDLTAGAGSNLTAIYASNADQGVIGIANTTGNGDNWRVDVRRADTNWNGDLVIAVKRTADGTGGGTISGGTAYQSVGTTDATLFSGSGDRSNILIQLQISGASVSVPPSTYSTSIIYTVVDIP